MNLWVDLISLLWPLSFYLTQLTFNWFSYVVHIDIILFFTSILCKNVKSTVRF